MTHHHIHNLAASARAVELLADADTDDLHWASPTSVDIDEYAAIAEDPNVNPLTDSPGLCNDRCVAKHLTADDEVATPATQNQEN